MIRTRKLLNRLTKYFILSTALPILAIIILSAGLLERYYTRQLLTLMDGYVDSTAENISMYIGNLEQVILLPYFDGIHLKGTALSLIADFSAHCMVGFSAHSPKEVREALCNGASYATLSPIFATPHKGTPIGIESLRALDSHARARTFGLGGIDTPSKLAQLVQIENLYGFASIRYFLGEV